MTEGMDRILQGHGHLDHLELFPVLIELRMDMMQVEAEVEAEVAESRDRGL